MDKKKQKEQWIQSGVKIDEIRVGMQFLNWETKQLSTVTNMTTNSVELHNRADWKSRTDGKADAEGELQEAGRLKGISSKNWYAMDQFNRKFVKIDDIIQYRLDKLLEWSEKRQESNKFKALYAKFEHYI